MKIAVMHATAGAGHLKAAEAVYDGIKKYTDYEAHLVDVLDYTSPLFKKMYAGTYVSLVKYLPSIWGFVFACVDIPFLQGLIRGFRRIHNHLNARKLENFLIDNNFDYVVATHFMPTEIISSLKRQKKVTTKLITCVTDYDVHRIWTADGVDQYCVATEWSKRRCVAIGVAEHKVAVTGIPTNELFSAAYDVGSVKDKLQIERERFTVLVATGSFGIGPIEEIIQALDDFQVIVVCGHNASLYKTLTDKQYPNARVFGLVDNMHELMAVSDAMVTKPGGLSISEALVMQLPLIFFNPIPGQETNNIKVLNEHGVGISSKNIKHITNELTKLKTSHDLLTTVLMKTKAISRPSAVKDIVGLLK